MMSISLLLLINVKSSEGLSSNSKMELKTPSAPFLSYLHLQDIYIHIDIHVPEFPYVISISLEIVISKVQKCVAIFTQTSQVSLYRHEDFKNINSSDVPTY